MIEVLARLSLEWPDLIFSAGGYRLQYKRPRGHVRLCEAHDGGRFCYHLARENYYLLPIATFFFASDIPSEGTTIDKGPSGLGKEIRKTYAVMQSTLKSQQT